MNKENFAYIQNATEGMILLENRSENAGLGQVLHTIAISPEHAFEMSRFLKNRHGMETMPYQFGKNFLFFNEGYVRINFEKWLGSEFNGFDIQNPQEFITQLEICAKDLVVVK